MTTTAPRPSIREYLNAAAAMIHDHGLRSVVKEALYIEDFYVKPAAIRFHHTYEGGLAAHTLEVVNTAIGIFHVAIGVNPDKEPLPQSAQTTLDVLITAAILHDTAKTLEYVKETLLVDGDTDPGFNYHPTYGKQIHHIQGSFAAFTAAAAYHSVSHELREAVGHAILAHHGRKEWGSPVEPQTLAATILHQADYLSAHYGAWRESLPEGITI